MYVQVCMYLHKYQLLKIIRKIAAVPVCCPVIQRTHQVYMYRYVRTYINTSRLKFYVKL